MNTIKQLTGEDAVDVLGMSIPEYREAEMEDEMLHEAEDECFECGAKLSKERIAEGNDMCEHCEMVFAQFN